MPFQTTPFTPLSIPSFLQENSHLLRPPINNSVIFQDEHMSVMLVGGPNQRTDFHINSTPEFFYQVKGGMTLRVVEKDDGGDGKPVYRDIAVGEGEMYLLPGNTPHSPIRYADTIGIVVEMTRPQGVEDKLRWYCEICGKIVCEERFICVDLGTQVKDAVEIFASNEDLRRCKGCGTIAKVKGGPEPKP